jgi:hypothetical protein
VFNVAAIPNSYLAIVVPLKQSAMNILLNKIPDALRHPLIVGIILLLISRLLPERNKRKKKRRAGRRR